jgi:hypothetical protein
MLQVNRGLCSAAPSAGRGSGGRLVKGSPEAKAHMAALRARSPTAKLVKGSEEARQYMASIRGKKKQRGWAGRVPEVDLWSLAASGEDVECVLEAWEHSARDSPHCYSADHMAVVVEGKATMRYYGDDAGRARPLGASKTLLPGRTVHVCANEFIDVAYAVGTRVIRVFSGPWERIDPKTD